MQQAKIFFLVILFCISVCGCEDDSSPTENDGGNKVDLRITALRQNEPLDTALVVVSLAANNDEAVAFASTDVEGQCTLPEVEKDVYLVEVSKSDHGTLLFGFAMIDLSTVENGIDLTIDANEEKSDYFPLALGNTWTSSDGADSILTTAVLETKMVNGVITYILEPVGEDTHPPYMTHGVSAVYWHGYETMTGGDHIYPQPVVFMGSEAAVGTVWAIPDWGSVELVASGFQVVVPAGTFDGCMQYIFTADVEVSEMTLAPGVGPVLTVDEMGTTYELVSYELH
jgi:hypothetical protein